MSGRGLFLTIRDYYPRKILYLTLFGVLIGNVIEAAADIGGMAAAMNLLMPIPIPAIVVGTTLTILALQFFGSYRLISNIFRWLALVLLAYVGSAVLARPEIVPVLYGTFVPTIQLNSEFLSILVAIIGTTLSAYLYSWKTNEEVEEEIAQGRTRLEQRKGTTRSELRLARNDILLGMLFSTIIMYFIMLSTASTLYKAGQTDISTAAQAAEALRPLAGDAAGILFSLGIVGVGFLSVPVMTAGAAYDVAQVMGWKCSLHARPSEAKEFYGTILLFTAMAMALNFLGFNPMKALVWSGIVQGFSTPPLLLLIMLMTTSRRIMGARINSLWMNILGWTTTAVIFAASIGLVLTWLI